MRLDIVVATAHYFLIKIIRYCLTMNSHNQIMQPREDELWIAYTRIFFVELAYWIVSIGTVFANEFVLDEILTADLTVFITLFQITFALSILLTFNLVNKLLFATPNERNKYDDDEQVVCIRNEEDSSNDNSEMDEVNLCDYSSSKTETKSLSDRSLRPSSSDDLAHLFIIDIPYRISLETCRAVFPLSILYAGMLLLNNYCLKNVGVGFYFVSRSLTTVFNVIFTYFLMDQPVSLGAVLCCGAVVSGFLLGIDQESVLGSLSVIGVAFGVSSSLFSSLFTIFTKKTLDKLDRNIWVLMLYNNINSIAICIPLVIVHGDFAGLLSGKIISPTFWFLLSVSGVMSFFTNIVTNVSIRYTSPLTHNISGTAKSCVQTTIAELADKKKKTILWWLSNIVILIASAVYSRIKQLEMERNSVQNRNCQFKKIAETVDELDPMKDSNNCCAIGMKGQAAC